RLRAVAEEQAQIAHKLSEVGTILARSLERGTIVQKVTDVATELTGADFGAFFYDVTDHQTGETELHYTVSGLPTRTFADVKGKRAASLFTPPLPVDGVIRLDDLTRRPAGSEHESYIVPQTRVPVRGYLAVSVSTPSGEILG